jgi:hypothetical protein
LIHKEFRVCQPRLVKKLKRTVLKEFPAPSLTTPDLHTTALWPILTTASWLHPGMFVVYAISRFGKALYSHHKKSSNRVPTCTPGT